jgi:hypothetical protein
MLLAKWASLENARAHGGSSPRTLFLAGQTSGQIFETPSGERRRWLGAIKGRKPCS